MLSKLGPPGGVTCTLVLLLYHYRGAKPSMYGRYYLDHEATQPNN